MSEHLDRARRYHDGIRRILPKDWDPIGVADIPEAQDEYDSYVGKIYGMLIRHEPRHKIVDQLVTPDGAGAWRFEGQADFSGVYTDGHGT